uniref:Brefeldin A-inhibited guanine nucleotide-exchange protein n=1 Tax=Hirondellea gigas TaxID=1518452 RepID=A0A6A7G2U5_9CRUS
MSSTSSSSEPIDSPNVEPKRAIQDLLAVINNAKALPSNLKLKEFCEAFLDPQHSNKFFEIVSFPEESKEPPIVDIGVIFKDDKNEDLPADYEILEKTCGGRNADVNKGSGGKYVYLCYRRSFDSKPVTAASVIVTQMDEEAPHGFDIIAKTVGGNSANLNAGSHGRSIHLTVHRGTGPRIRNIALVFTGRETLDRSYRKIERTPRGRSADLNSGSDGRVIHLAYELDFDEYIGRFAEFSHLDSVLTRCVACICAGLFCYEYPVILQAMRSFSMLGPVPTELVSAFGYAVCDSLILYISYFSGEVHINYLQFIKSFFKDRLDSLDSKVVMRLFETCMFLRHEDNRVKASREMVDGLVAKIPACIRCRCQGAEYEFSTFCPRCEQISQTESPAIQVLVESILHETVNNVVVSKYSQFYVGKFMRSHRVDECFRKEMTNFVEPLFPAGHERLLVSALIVLCKFIGQPLPDKLSGKSEKIKRRIHALHVLSHILEESPQFFQGTSAAVVVMRRIFCTSFVDNLATVVPALFQTAMKFFGFLWNHFVFTLKSDLGSLLDICLLGMLKSNHCTPGQKIDVIEGLSLVFKTPQSIANLYYNFDNDIDASNVFESLVTSISKLTEGSRSENRYGLPEDNLQHAGLAFLINIMEFLHRWILSPRHSSEGSISSEDSISDSISVAPESIILEIEDKPSQVIEATSSQFLEPGISPTRRKKSRPDTWTIRFDTVKERKRMESEAIKISHSEKLKTAVKYLWTLHPHPSVSYIAKFLYNNSPLDKQEIGDFLGSAAIDNLFTEAQMCELRDAYVRLLDFTSLSFDEGLRHFLVDSNFRIPGESQKIDRIMKAFSDQYYHDNPGVFKTANGAYVTSFAILMLNTDIHDPRLRTGANTRSPMTKDEFVRNLKDVEEIPRAFLEKQFDAIVKREIKWKNEATDGYADDAGNLDHISIQRGFRDECRTMSRKCQAALRSSAFFQASYSSTSNKEIAKGIFSVSWFRFLLAITILLQHSKDTEVLGACLDGLKFGATISIRLGSIEELESYANILSQFIFAEDNKFKDASEISRLILKGEHQKVEWFQALKESALEMPEEACKLFSSLVNNMKSRVVYSGNQDALRKIEQDFAGEIVLKHPHRTFLRAGNLSKVSHTNKPQEYQFFLFSDLLLYASETYSAFKYHRALHLSLCKVVDIRNSERNLRNAWKVISPQKSITVFASTEQQKSEWIEAIQAAIDSVIKHRRIWMRHGKLRNAKPGTTPAESQLMSAFIGRSYPDDLRDQKSDFREEQPCKLCVRPFGVIRRKLSCSWCQDYTCKQCSSHSVEIPSSRRKRRVCDSCYGFLSSNLRKQSSGDSS